MNAQNLQLGRRSFLAASAALGAVAVAASITSANAANAPASFTSIDDWIVRASIPFSDANFNAACDRMMSALGEQVSVLGFGEALHGGEEHFALRNRVFK